MDHFKRYMDIIPDFDSFTEFLSRPLPITVRINTLKIDRSRLMDRLDRAGIEHEEMGWYPLGLRLGPGIERPGKLIEHLLGYVHIQEEVSMIPPIVLDSRPGEEVLDLCASPGSKTTHISQIMENRGLIIANEPSLSRVTPLRSNCERLGVLNTAITRYDGRRFPDHLFDRVLVDAPCSSEGMARKDAEMKDRCSLKRSLDLQVLQKGLLKRAVNLTKPGGVIVYSTCTYAPEENEAIVNHVLDDVRAEPVSIRGLKGSPGVTEWNGESFSDDLKLCTRYYPHHNDTGGFFVARLVRR